MLAPLISVLAAVAAPADRPNLVVVISIDQFRSDYLRRFEDLYLPPGDARNPGGFRFLTEGGADFINSAFTHVPTETGPGHAVIGTGSCPPLNGIVGNEWFDRESGKIVYCVSDPGSKDVTTGQASMSAKNLWTTTMGDELEQATGGASKTVSVALKDRASILMAGHKADQVVWYDRRSGSWTTSDYYAPDGKLPAWAVEVNGRRIPDMFKGKSWTAALPASAHRRTRPAENPSAPAAFGKTFPHTPRQDDSFYDDWTRTPWANDFVIDTAIQALVSEGLGKDEVPDILTINLSTNDYVGHWFGPNSPEVLEISVATDRSLAKLFQAIQRALPRGLQDSLIVVTADHGVMPMAEDWMKDQVRGGRLQLADLRTPVDTALKAGFGEVTLVRDFGDMMITLDEAACRTAGVALDDAAQTIRDALVSLPFVHSAYTARQIQEGDVGGTLARVLAKSYNKDRYGHVVYFLRPGYIFGSAGTGHGSPWSYDANVPLLLLGPMIEPGVHVIPAGPEDIAPTVCAALGITAPNGCVGRAVGLKRN